MVFPRKSLPFMRKSTVPAVISPAFDGYLTAISEDLPSINRIFLSSGRDSAVISACRGTKSQRKTADNVQSVPKSGSALPFSQLEMVERLTFISRLLESCTLWYRTSTKLYEVEAYLYFLLPYLYLIQQKLPKLYVSLWIDTNLAVSSDNVSYIINHLSTLSKRFQSNKPAFID